MTPTSCTTHRHTTRETVSLIVWKIPNTGWCVDWLKRERRGREEMMGEEGKMSSSIKSPYVYSLSSIVHPGVRAGQAHVWAGWPHLRAVALGLAASGLPLLGLPLLQGPFLLDAGADLLLKPAHLLLELTDEIYHTLGWGGAVEGKWRAVEEGSWWDGEKIKRKYEGEFRGEENQTLTYLLISSVFGNACFQTVSPWLPAVNEGT